MKLASLFTYHHVIQNLYDSNRLWKVAYSLTNFLEAKIDFLSTKNKKKCNCDFFVLTIPSKKQYNFWNINSEF